MMSKNINIHSSTVNWNVWTPTHGKQEQSWVLRCALTKQSQWTEMQVVT